MRIGYQRWRALHWLAYASWPIALVHGLGTGTDARLMWMQVVAATCIAAVVASVLWRVAGGRATAGLRIAAMVAACGAPMIIGGWYLAGTGAARVGGTRRDAAVVADATTSDANHAAVCVGRIAPDERVHDRVQRSRATVVAGCQRSRDRQHLRPDERHRSGRPLDPSSGRADRRGWCLDDRERRELRPDCFPGRVCRKDRRTSRHADSPLAEQPVEQALAPRQPSRRRCEWQGHGHGSRHPELTAVSVGERIAPRAAPRLLGGLRDDGRPVSLAAHGERHGPLPLDLSPAELRERVTASGVTGRGGAGFPTGAKLDAVLRAGKRPIVVANGAEGEPPSGKDKVLLAYAPHLVIDGALLVAHAVNARQVVIATAAAARPFVKQALAERRREGRISVQTAGVPDRFVAGEETALVQFLNGGPALPTFAPPRPYERGVNGAPTVVLNVETLAHVALIARYGPAWFRSVGTPAEPGSALVTLSGAVRDPGVYEIELGSSFTALLEEGGATREAQAYLVGGYFGTWLSAADARRPCSRMPISLASVCRLARARSSFSRRTSAASWRHPELRATSPTRVLASADRVFTASPRSPTVSTSSFGRAGTRRMTTCCGAGSRRWRTAGPAVIPTAQSHSSGALLRVFADELERHLNGDRCNGHGLPLVPIP